MRLATTTVRCITVLRFVIFHSTRYVYNDRSTFRRFLFCVFFFLRFLLFLSVLLRFCVRMCMGMSLHSLSNDLLIFHTFCTISHKQNVHTWKNTMELKTVHTCVWCMDMDMGIGMRYDSYKKYVFGHTVIALFIRPR